MRTPTPCWPLPQRWPRRSSLHRPAPPTPVPAPGTYYVQSATTGLNAADKGERWSSTTPRATRDHQQWNLRASGSSYVLESTDTADSCLGRSGAQAKTVACTSADAAWQITGTGADQYTLQVPGTASYLTVAAKPSGANYPAQLAIGSSGSLASWYLTPITSPTRPIPAQDQRTLDQVTFLTAHNAYANGVDGGFAPPFVNFFPNQARGINQQLSDGVRGFMLDIHQTSDGAILCRRQLHPGQQPGRPERRPPAHRGLPQGAHRPVRHRLPGGLRRSDRPAQ
ncbi:hypothetical protein ACRAWF_02540 [Streptomyces sp. L7]